METPLKITVETLAIGDDELDCMALLNAVLKSYKNRLDDEGKERVTQWLAERHRPVRPEDR